MAAGTQAVAHRRKVRLGYNQPKNQPGSIVIVASERAKFTLTFDKQKYTRLGCAGHPTSEADKTASRPLIFNSRGQILANSHKLINPSISYRVISPYLPLVGSFPGTTRRLVLNARSVGSVDTVVEYLHRVVVVTTRVHHVPMSTVP